jgi:hypothetical protein
VRLQRVVPVAVLSVALVSSTALALTDGSGYRPVNIALADTPDSKTVSPQIYEEYVKYGLLAAAGIATAFISSEILAAAVATAEAEGCSAVPRSPDDPTPDCQSDGDDPELSQTLAPGYVAPGY